MEMRNSVTLVVLAALALVSTGSAVYFYRGYSQIRANPQKYVQESVEDLVKEVGQLMVLPQGETPTIATVVEPEKLKNQPFFANAKQGDKVLIYTNARKAILYDPLNRRIVEVAPLTIGQTSGAAAPAAAEPAAAPAQ